MSGIYDAVKAVAAEYEEGRQHVEIHCGRVYTESPLSIRLDSKLILKEKFLELTRNVTEYETECELKLESVNASGSCPDGNVSISGAAQGKGKILFKNRLKKGERVLLIRMQSGGKYIVLDRLEE